MIPFMVREGYDRSYAAGLTSVSGALGIIVPRPSIPLVIYGISTTTSIGDLFLAGFGPAIVIAALSDSHTELHEHPQGVCEKDAKASCQEIFLAVWDAKWALLMPVIILGGIYGGIFTPTEAAVVSIVYGIVIGLFVYRELKWKELFGMFERNASFVGGLHAHLCTGCGTGWLPCHARITRDYTPCTSFYDDKYVCNPDLAQHIPASAWNDSGMPCPLWWYLLQLFMRLWFLWELTLFHLGLIIVVNLAVGICNSPRLHESLCHFHPDRYSHR